MQSNLDLWLDHTLRTTACGTWWAAGTPGGPTLATLQLHPELVAKPDVRDRVAAAVAAVREANPAGVLRTTELVFDAKRAWLVVATTAKPTLRDLLARSEGGAKGSSEGGGVDRATLPPGAAAGLAVDAAGALRELHAAGLRHGDLNASTVVLTGAGFAVLAEAGVLAAVRDEPVDLGADVLAWAALVRRLATHTGPAETALLTAAAATAETGDLTAAARRLALAAQADLADFEGRDALAALLPDLAPAPDPVVVPRPRAEPSAVEPSLGEADTVEPVIRLRLGPGVPDEALLHPRAVDAAPAPSRRSRTGLVALIAAILILLGAGAAAWRFLQ